jgi:hypothetical protein
MSALASLRNTVLMGAESKSVKLHLLPELDLTSVTMKYAQSGTPPSQITVQSVDTDLRSKPLFHFIYRSADD